MSRCTIHTMPTPGCRQCDLANGYPITLTPEERQELLDRLVAGERIDLSAYSHADRLALRPFLRPRRPNVLWPTPTSAPEARPATDHNSVGQRMKRVVEHVQGNVRREGAGFVDINGFILHADENVLCGLIHDPVLLQEAMALRAEWAQSRPKAPSKEPEAPTVDRTKITADVLRLHREGRSVPDIAREAGVTRFQAQAIIDSQQ